MTDPCGSKEEINDMGKEQRQQGKDLAVVKEATDRLRMEQAAFISESREVIGLLKEMAIEGKSSAKQAKEAQDILFTKTRDNASAIRLLGDKFIEAKAAAEVRITEVVEKVIRPMKDDVKTLMDDKITRDSKMLLLKDMRVTVPVICSVVSSFLLAWKTFFP